MNFIMETIARLYFMYWRSFYPKDNRYLKIKSMFDEDEDIKINKNHFELLITDDGFGTIKDIELPEFFAHIDLYHIFNRPKDKNIFSLVVHENVVTVEGYCDPRYRHFTINKLKELLFILEEDLRCVN